MVSTLFSDKIAKMEKAMEEKIIHRKDTFHYALLQGSYFVAFCGLISCATVYLLENHFTSAEAGMILALANLISIFTQPLLADFVDQRPQIQLKHCAALISVFSFGLLIGLLFTQNKALIFVLYLTVALLQITLQPFVNTLGVGYHYHSYQINFGMARSMGSLVFSLTSLLIGQLALQMGGISVVVVSLAGTVLFALITLTFRSNEITAGKKQEQSSSLLSFVSFHRRFMLLLVGLTLGSSSHMLVVTFLLPIFQQLGKGSQEMGVALFICGIVEIPIMFLFNRINRRIKSSALLKIASIAFILKTLMIALAKDASIIYLAQFFQMFSYALFIPASVHYTSCVIEEKDKAKGQACVGIALSASGVVGCLLGGILIDLFSIQAMLFCGVLVGVLGALIVFSSVDSHAG